MSDQEQAFSGWDKNLNFEEQEAYLIWYVKNIRNRQKKTRAAILLIQLVNGGRISEAIDCAFQWAETGKREQRVLARKRRKDKYMRLMIVPTLLNDYPQIREELAVYKKNTKNPANAMASWVKDNFKFNSHALRYSFIGRMSDDTPAQVIAKMTGQKKLDMILHYTTRRAAEDKLRKVIK